MSSAVLDDLPCLVCGYNLRTLDSTGICPECTHPVASSLAGDQLSRADRRWLTGVRRGLLIDAIGLSCLIAYGLAQDFSLVQGKFPNILFMLLLGVYALLTFVAGLLLSASEPFRPRRFMSFLLRWTSVLLAITFVIQCVDEIHMTLHPSPTRSAIEQLWDTAGQWLFLAFPVRFGAELFFLSMLARRARRTHLLWQSRLLGWIVSVVVGVDVLATPVSNLLTSPSLRMELSQVNDYLDNVCMALLVYVTILLMVSFFRLRPRVKEVEPHSSAGYD